VTNWCWRWVCRRRDGDFGSRRRWRRSRSACGLQQETQEDRPDAGRPEGWVVRNGSNAAGVVSKGVVGRAIVRGPGPTELVLPRPALGEMPGGAAGRAGDACGPASQVVGDDLHCQPGGVGGEAARWQMIETHPVLEVADGVLNLGVATVVGLQFQCVAVPVGDEAVIAVGGEQSQLGTGCGFDPPDDESHRCGVGLAPEGSAGGFGRVGGALHPIGNERPVRLGYGFDEIAPALMLADGDGEADPLPATDGDHGVGEKPLSARTVS